MQEQSTGTGVFEPFVRLQANGNEMGYNTDAAPPNYTAPLDIKTGKWTRAIPLGDIPIVTYNGAQYREFALDLHESDNESKRYITLNQVQIFIGPDPFATYSLNPGPFSADNYPVISFTDAEKVFQMNGLTGTNSIEMNSKLNPGSGAGDMRLFVLNSNFAEFSNADNLIFFSQFGNPPGTSASEATFKEWGVLSQPTQVPEPTSLMLLGLGLIGVGAVARRKIKK